MYFSLLKLRAKPFRKIISSKITQRLKQCRKRFSESSKKKSALLTSENMNQNIKKVEYAVRGPLLIRAQELEKELKKSGKKPFTQVIKANLGDPQAMGQKPITFFRQVMSLVSYPELLKCDSFPADAICRAEELLTQCLGRSVGAYSEAMGIELIRKDTAEFICDRDGFESHHDDIVLSSGASEIIKSVLNLFNENSNGKPAGVMIPCPQYPLFSASLTELGMHLIGYYLDEEKNWNLNVDELNRSLNEAKEKCNPRAIVIVNPGNPTGQVLTKDNIIEIVKFAHQNKLVMLADEVYQWNIHSKSSEFHSLKKIINELGEPYEDMELASFMSCSKGYMGECGIRGGYCEFTNFDPEVRAHFNKTISSVLCPNLIGQCLLDCIVKPPEEGDPSYDLFEEEKDKILEDMKKKAKLVYETFNNMKGLSCKEIQGAMYAFPKLNLPPKAIEEAKKNNMPPDTFYAFQLLESTGICVISGSGFHQAPGTYHFRTTILPKLKDLKKMLKSIEDFHRKFMKKYS